VSTYNVNYNERVISADDTYEMLLNYQVTYRHGSALSELNSMGDSISYHIEWLLQNGPLVDGVSPIPANSTSQETTNLVNAGEFLSIISVVYSDRDLTDDIESVFWWGLTNENDIFARRLEERVKSFLPNLNGLILLTYPTHLQSMTYTCTVNIDITGLDETQVMSSLTPQANERDMSVSEQVFRDPIVDDNSSGEGTDPVLVILICFLVCFVCVIPSYWAIKLWRRKQMSIHRITIERKIRQTWSDSDEEKTDEYFPRDNDFTPPHTPNSHSKSTPRSPSRGTPGSPSSYSPFTDKHMRDIARNRKNSKQFSDHIPSSTVVTAKVEKVNPFTDKNMRNIARNRKNSKQFSDHIPSTSSVAMKKRTPRLPQEVQMTDFRRGSHQSTQSVNLGRNSNQTRRPLSAGANVTPKRRRPQRDVALANPEESEYFFDQDPLREIQMRQSNPSQARGIGSEIIAGENSVVFRRPDDRQEDDNVSLDESLSYIEEQPDPTGYRFEEEHYDPSDAEDGFADQKATASKRRMSLEDEDESLSYLEDDDEEDVKRTDVNSQRKFPSPHHNLAPIPVYNDRSSASNPSQSPHHSNRTHESPRQSNLTHDSSRQYSSRGTSGRLQPPNRTPGRVKNPSPGKVTPKQITTPSTGWGAQEQVFDYKTERMNNIKMMHLKNMISIGQYQKLVELVGEENENVCPLLDTFGPKDDLMNLVTELQHWVYHYSKEPEEQSDASMIVKKRRQSAKRVSLTPRSTPLKQVTPRIPVIKGKSPHSPVPPSPRDFEPPTPSMSRPLREKSESPSLSFEDHEQKNILNVPDETGYSEEAFFRPGTNRSAVSASTPTSAFV